MDNQYPYWKNSSAGILAFCFSWAEGRWQSIAVALQPSPFKVTFIIYQIQEFGQIEETENRLIFVFLRMGRDAWAVKEAGHTSMQSVFASVIEVPDQGDRKNTHMM